MLRFLGRRLITTIVTLLIVTMVAFAVARLTPGDPLDAASRDDTLARLGPEQLRELRAIYHLDRPLWEQYVRWLRDALRGDLGRSFHDRRPVREKIAERFGVSLTLNAAALALTVLFAVPLGTLAAYRPGSRLDRWSGAGTYALYALPVFWAGLLLQLLFSVQLGWLPISGLESDGAGELGRMARAADRAAHLVLPVLCLGYGGIAYVSRFVRSNLIESGTAEAVRAARARGLPGLTVLVRHGFRRSAIPLLTLAGFLLPSLVGGSVIVETIFNIPGLGRLFYESIFLRDLPVSMGLILLSGVATLLGILGADVAYAIADPRVRRSARG